VTGPTASGKPELAIALAERFDGEIVNADSMQVYRFMDIGTAKPTLEQRARVPHHLLDVVTPDQPYNAGLYQQGARKAIADVRSRNRLPLLVGGSGLYIRAVLEGLLETGASDPERRDELEAEHASAVAAGEPERLYRRLQRIDPDAAAKIHANDARRTVRALEICEAGVSASTRRAGHGFRDRPYRTLHLAIDPGREVLNKRIDVRCAQMIEAGLLREARALREMGYGAELRPLQSIGYRHMAPVVDGADTLANALKEMQRDTRRFARRQRTWLRRVESVVWLNADERPAVEARVEAYLEKEGAA
jgi:tRNA dimethylallyltransferase